MKIAVGTVHYTADEKPIKATGIGFSDEQLNLALTQRVPALLKDEAGKKQAEDMLAGLATTAFASDRLQAALNVKPEPQDWQVGEALAEAYLVDHCDCEFPWPHGRDLRNPKASAAGADLVGFQAHAGKTRLAFGEVKTSEEEKWPPQVMTSRHGLEKQLELLRDSTTIKDHLMIYLAMRAVNTSWKAKYQQAAARYLHNPQDVALFGFLVRDVIPKPEDLKERGKKLATGCPTGTSIELRALYLSPKSIPTLAKRVFPKKGGAA